MTYNSRVGTYVYPSPGQPRPHAPTTINGGSMTYDPNGNLLTGRGRTYTWDWENLPTQINTTQFVYGADRSRLKKLDSGNATLYPLGDDYEIVGGTVTKYVTAFGVGVLGKRVGPTPFWSHLDHLGSITLVTDDSGVDSLRRIYRPFGDLLAQSGSGENSRGFIDQRQDAETGLFYLHARYFDPSLATFTASDPLHPAGVGVGTNRYAYAFGNPINGHDRSGLGCDTVDGTLTTMSGKTTKHERQYQDCRYHDVETVITIRPAAEFGRYQVPSWSELKRRFADMFRGLGSDSRDPKPPKDAGEATAGPKKPGRAQAVVTALLAALEEDASSLTDELKEIICAGTIDVNASVGIPLGKGALLAAGPTGGLLIGRDGIRPYFGLNVSSPGWNTSVTYSPQAASEGLTSPLARKFGDVTSRDESHG